MEIVDTNYMYLNINFPSCMKIIDKLLLFRGEVEYKQ